MQRFLDRLFANAGRFCYVPAVIRLIRFLLWAMFWFLFLWLAVTVPIGNYTLYQHVVRLVRTKEAQELKEGLKETAKNTTKKLEHEWETSPKQQPVPQKR